MVYAVEDVQTLLCHRKIVTTTSFVNSVIDDGVVMTALLARMATANC